MFHRFASKSFIILAVLAVALVSISFASRPKAVLSADRSYDRIEQIRSARLNANLYYDKLEALRLQRSAGGSGMESSYDPIERIRVERGSRVDNSFHTPPMSNYRPVDHSFHTPPMSDLAEPLNP